MSPDLRQIVDVAPLLRSGALSPVALVQACLAQIDARPEINAFITRLDAQALADAEDCEREIRTGRYRGPLHGIPISVKDLIDVAGVKTTSGSALARTRGGVGRTRHRAAPRRRRRHHRQDEPPRVRVRHDERGVRLRSGAESARPVAVGRRLERRRRRRAGDGHVLRRARHRYRRLDPHSVGGLRHGRAQGDGRRDLLRGRRSPQQRRSIIWGRWREASRTSPCSSRCSPDGRRGQLTPRR